MKTAAWLMILLLFVGLFAGCDWLPWPPDNGGNGGDNGNNGDNGDNGNNGDNGDNGNGGTIQPRGTVLAAVVSGDVLLLGDDGQTTPATSFGDVSYVLWSPDGSRLLIYRHTLEELWVMDDDGSNLRFLERGVNMSRYDMTSGYMWSPDSTKVAYLMSQSPVLTIVNLEIPGVNSYVVPAEGGQGPWWNSSSNMLALTQMMTAEPADVRDEYYDPDEDYDEFYWRSFVFLLDMEGVERFRQHSATTPRWFGDQLFFSNYRIDIISGYQFSIGTSKVNSLGQNLLPVDISIGNGNFLPSGRIVTSTDTIVNVINLTTLQVQQVAEQDSYITFSEFYYPFQYSLAMHADLIATLEFNRLNHIDDYPQEGYWDLKVYNLGNEQSWTVWSEVYRWEESNPDVYVPLDWIIPSFWWSADGAFLYLVMGNSSQLDIWQVASDGQGNPSLLFANSSFLASRPQ